MAKINIVGPHVRRFRIADGLEQQDLAARCGVLGWHISRGTIAKIESQVRRVTDGELFILAAALRRPMPELFPTSRKEALSQVRQADTS